MYKFLQGRLILVRVIMLAAMLALIAVGIANIYAVGHPAQTARITEQGLWKKQVVFAGIGFAAFLAVNTVSYRRFGSVSYAIYAAVLVLLGVLLLDRFVDISIAGIVTVPVRNGTRRWIVMGAGGKEVSLQVSEFCKIAYILALSWYLRYRSNYRKFTGLIGPFALTLLPMVLILLEPDLGTVILMMPILFLMLFMVGAKGKHLLIIILMALLISPILWHKMKPYQRVRIGSLVLQNEWVRQQAAEHPALAKVLVGENKFSEKEWKRGAGFHLIRSKYAIASGGLRGYGFRQGPFVKYNFLPERHNDFIFATIAHQWGFWGCLALLSLYGILIACGIEIAANNTDPFGRLIAVGIVGMFTVMVLVNISMTLGLMPITGLTLPLVSYGGSSLLVSMVAVGLLNNVGRCRPFGISRKRSKSDDI